ncbi:MAG TPA: SUMF1/EgtB/PvdO family nonheme iron enzyme [Polyangiaceae bacterium]|nr:SUMF1/EgtB/PvdO family nonheme iron enzyme [Polyangiaceae bacterium]
MVAIPAGAFVQGHEPAEHADEGPPRRVEIAAFWLDEALVTRAEFARFVAETGHVTNAERVGYGMIAREGMRDWEWRRAPGASWRRPFEEGTPGAEAFLRDDAPVVMVSWFDAAAYCERAGKRLPTEAEWEYAMRAGREGARFPWGDSPRREGGRLGLNFWQGESHAENAREDGFLYVSPVRAFAPNAWGVYDPVGNVWQWTADVYDAKAYARGGPPREGPKRVLRGGSWWCGVCTCEGYGLHFRGKAEPNAAFNNNGFRCAQTPAR